MDNGITPKPCDICFKKGNTLKDVWNNNWKDKFEDPTLFNEDYSVNIIPDTSTERKGLDLFGGKLNPLMDKFLGNETGVIVSSVLVHE